MSEGNKVVNYAGRVTGYTIPDVKVYDLVDGQGKVRFTADQVQAVKVIAISSPEDWDEMMEVGIMVYLFNGHKFELEPTYKDELLAYVKAFPEE